MYRYNALTKFREMGDKYYHTNVKPNEEKNKKYW